MNNELYPSSFKNQSAYRNSMPPCDWSTFSTFKPPPIVQSNHTGQLPVASIKADLLKQQQAVRRQIVPNGNSYLQSNSKLSAVPNASNRIALNGNSANKLNLRSKSPPPKVPQRNSSQLASSKHVVDQPDASPLWRSKSFAGGLQQTQPDQFVDQHNVQKTTKISLRQAPVTYANPSAANRNTIHLGKPLDDKAYGLNNNLNNVNNNLSPCSNQNCCNQTDQEAKNHHINKVNDEISQRYLAAAESNFNAMNGLNKMRHSQSHHSYLSTKAPVQTTNSFNTGTLPNSVSFHGQPLNTNKPNPSSLDASSLSSIGSSGSGSLTRSKSLFLLQIFLISRV